MILVNLLPHREEARKYRRQAFNVLLLLAAAVGLGLGGLCWFYYDLRIMGQESVNSFIKAENVQLDSKIKDVEGVEVEVAALRDRQQAVEGLQQERNNPVKLFNELSATIPDGLYFVSIKQNAETVELRGVAQSNERVSEFLRRLRDSELLAKSPQLEETVVQDVTLSNKSKSKAYGFKIVLTMNTSAKPAPQKSLGAGAQPAASAGA